MFGALKDWAFGQSPKRNKVNSSSRRQVYEPVRPMLRRESTSIEDEHELGINGYGHLLLCPLCQEIYTHPVLLPCQHSLCYGCARAQILSSDSVSNIENAEQISKVGADRSFMSPAWSATSSSSSRNRSISTRVGESPFLRYSNETFSSDSGCRADDSEASLNIPNNDCFYVESPLSSVSKSPVPNLISPKFKKIPSRSNLSVTPNSSIIHPLRRSNSTSAVSRPITVKCRPQQIYGTLRRSKVKSLFCPNCREMVELGKLGISGLFRNFALESIVERFRVKAKAAVAIRCGYCKPPSSDATRSCLDCKLSYCNECYKLIHIWGTKKARHNFVSPTNNFVRPKVLLCPEHSNEASMYCNKCKKSVCRLCKTGGGAHTNHSISSAKTAYREGKERLCRELEKLRQKKEDVDAKIVAFGEVFTELERREAETREKIHFSLDGMYKILEAKRSELLTKAESKFRNNEQFLRQELQCHHQKLMATSIANFAEEVLKETDPIYFLQTSQMLELRLKEVLNNLEDLEKVELIYPSDDLKLDTHSAELELRKINFITIPNNEVACDSRARKLDKERFTWIIHQHDGFVELDESNSTVHIPSSQWEPCVLKGSCAYSRGEYMWQISVTSFGAKRILIGVGYLNADEKLHGSIIHDRIGVFLMITAGSVSVFDGNWPCPSMDESNELKSLNSNVSIGEHHFTIRLVLIIDENEAIVHFYDVQRDFSVKIIAEKSFKTYGPVNPLVIVKGKAVVKLE